MMEILLYKKMILIKYKNRRIIIRSFQRIIMIIEMVLLNVLNHQACLSLDQSRNLITGFLRTECRRVGDGDICRPVAFM